MQLGIILMIFLQCELQHSSLHFVMLNKAKQSYAPFGSVSSKGPKKKKNKQGVQPGPGAYDISLPFIEPIVQTIKKSNNNVIVKLGHFGTAAFLAGGDRFLAIKQDPIGPGKYNNFPASEHEKSEHRKYRKYAAEQIRDIIKNPFQTNPTITEVRRVSFDDQVEMPYTRKKLRNKQSGSGNVRGLMWSRMSEQRQLKSDLSSSNILGPGSYEVSKPESIKKLQRHPSSAFSSNSVRSYLDQLVFETNQDLKARQRHDRKYKSDAVGPGSYDIGMDGGKKLYKYQFFGSTQQRP